MVPPDCTPLNPAGGRRVVKDTRKSPCTGVRTGRVQKPLYIIRIMLRAYIYSTL